MGGRGSVFAKEIQYQKEQRYEWKSDIPVYVWLTVFSLNSLE